jgi:Protein of unknown function (DUF2786)
MGTHTPRSLLWLLANGSNQFGLVELLCSMHDADVDHEAESMLLAQIRAAWARGWQPIELHRQGYRGCNGKAAGKLTALAIAVDHASRRADIDPQSRAQIERLQLPTATGGDGWLTGFIAHERLDRSEAMRTVIDAVHNLLTLRPLQPLGGGDDASADPVLAKIRALLAKAESTTFEAEALAFTSKAQQLMTRHAIDLAAVHGAGARRTGGAAVIRVPIDSPYSTAKAKLLAVVADASRCRTVELVGFGLAEVIGMPSDLVGVELLFTSLLVQAQTALVRAPRSSRSYRSSFLFAFAARIGERLREINAAVMKDATQEHGESFLPVLRSQAESIDAFVDERYGRLRSLRRRGAADPAGWVGGRTAADNAKLTFGDLAS